MPVNCPNCGFEIRIPSKIIRMSPRGSGAHYADKIQQLGIDRSEILEVLQKCSCYDFQTGMTSRQIAARVRDIKLIRTERYETDHSLTGRISELQGLKLVTSEKNEVEMFDKLQAKYRVKKFNRFFLTEMGKRVPIDPKWNPQSHSEVIL